MKSLQTRPLMIAGGMAFAVHAIFGLLGLLPVLLLQGNPAVLENYFSNINPDEFPAGLIAGFAVIWLVLCFVPFLTDMAAGVLYVILHNRATPIELQDGFLGGAAAAALARIGAQVLSTLASMLLTPWMMSQMMDITGDIPGGVSGGLPVSGMAIGLMGGLFGGVISICTGGLMGAVFGGAGGGITAAIVERRSEKTGYA